MVRTCHLVVVLTSFVHLLSLVVLDFLSVCSSPKVLNSSPLAAETYGVGISCGETGQGI